MSFINIGIPPSDRYIPTVQMPEIASTPLDVFFPGFFRKRKAGIMHNAAKELKIIVPV